MTTSTITTITTKTETVTETSFQLHVKIISVLTPHYVVPLYVDLVSPELCVKLTIALTRLLWMWLHAVLFLVLFQ